jgi:acetyl-CoA carboxylase / biotin carboxylase 1
VSLKAREVLILGQMPSYEERLIQMEAVLKNSVTNNYYGEQGLASRYMTFVVEDSFSDRRPLFQNAICGGLEGTE